MRHKKVDLSHAHNAAILLGRLRRTLHHLNSQPSVPLDELSQLIKAVDLHLSRIPESNELQIWRFVSCSLHSVRSQLKCHFAVRQEQGDLLYERERLAVLCRELRILFNNIPGYAQSESQFLIDDIIQADNRSIDPDNLVALLLSLPLPITYWRNREATDPFGSMVSEGRKQASITPLIRIVAFLDNIPLVTPQLLQTQVVYSLAFQIHGLIWPRDAQLLTLDLLSTYPTQEYSVSDFVMKKPDHVENEEYKGILAGHIRFATPQTQLSDNISFSVRCAFQLSDGNPLEVLVIGHSQLEFRALDPKRHGFISNYRRLDVHVVKLIEELTRDMPAIQDELPELLDVLEALTRILGGYAQGAVFKETAQITERDFQANVLRDLRLILGEDVQEHTSQAGGITDVRYRGVIIELKVEEQSGDREYICQKYTKQLTQYESVESRQVGILLVLDLTPKREPPADIRNDILLVDVATHGGDDSKKKYPAKAFVFVVNGNIRNPSAYSR